MPLLTQRVSATDATVTDDLTVGHPLIPFDALQIFGDLDTAKKLVSLHYVVFRAQTRNIDVEEALN